MATERLNKFRHAVQAVGSEQLLPNAVDRIAETNPGRMYAEIPFSIRTFDAGFRSVSYVDLANAVNGMAWWIHRALGSSSTCEPICYMGPNYLLRNVVLLANCKAGYSTLMMTPRFNAIAHDSFIKQCNCNKIIIPQGPEPADKSIIALYDKVLRAPTLEKLFSENFPHFKFEKSFQEVKTEPLVILHTSSTTDFPKPIIWTHEYVASYVKERRLDPPKGFESIDRLMLGGKLICSFPPAHASLTWVTLIFTVYCGSRMVFLLSGTLPTVSMLVECARHKKVDALILVPPQIEELAIDSEALQTISQNGETMFYAGGDITIAAGDTISSKMKLITTCGSTEQGFWHTIYPTGTWNPKIWKYMRVHPAQKLTFRHQSEDLFEATYTLNESSDGYKQSIFTVFPENPVYPTGDLFSPHVDDPELWQFRGRADDMQSFITSEKFHPTQMERIIGTHPGVTAVLFVGTRRPKGALLVELRNPSEDKEAFLESLWPLVEEANKPVPYTAKITKDMILITDEALPMARSVKGTIERRSTVRLYEQKLDVLYAVHA
ncbi:hypothetical protein BCIN_12g00620 [Botrytis cinerea B05.10]|uniref:AMP-dependent synthetase/ligase domain-containing protein n=1 Tax=Botryotinia fuckeliana (strain B05.10) TaxID=332648 RepID=A0A384JY57_BOTFB|nr:hypothetical protein BCIN_12g00620 [Botrytis cinerea B05.10]ATZ55468.1 hypothetical protein BCIN_12g00620 [Botrytis cinerea B05.10]